MIRISRVVTLMTQSDDAAAPLGRRSPVGWRRPANEGADMTEDHMARDNLEFVNAITSEIASKLIACRRDLHRHAESGWTEFRTASLAARRLAELGYEVLVGRQALDEQERMGVPAPAQLEACWQRAGEQGGASEYLDAMRGGFTAVVGILRRGDGPTIGLRFDMDALDIVESQESTHRPAREGFASINPGVAHACGHDAHTAVGLGVAEVLMRLSNRLRGTVKLIFQPAEEGVRGAKAMVSAGVVDDVDYLLGWHVHTGWALGECVPGMGGYLATQKFDITFTGAAAHAGGNPEGGKNALLAAATAVLNLYAIPRHGSGATRINVGKLDAGVGRNVICPTAHLVAETRGDTTALSDYMYERAMRVVQAAGAMYDCEVQITRMGGAQSANSDAELAGLVEQVAAAIGGFTFFPARTRSGSEDFTYMMERVQGRGGLTTNIGLGADLHGIRFEATQDRERVLAAHTPVFDFDERVLLQATQLLSATVLDIMRRHDA
jgi:aminobenzoyl-glutamate utilization protein A